MGSILRSIPATRAASAIAGGVFQTQPSQSHTAQLGCSRPNVVITWSIRRSRKRASSETTPTGHLAGAQWGVANQTLISIIALACAHDCVRSSSRMGRLGRRFIQPAYPSFACPTHRRARRGGSGCPVYRNALVKTLEARTHQSSTTSNRTSR